MQLPLSQVNCSLLQDPDQPGVVEPRWEISSFIDYLDAVLLSFEVFLIKMNIKFSKIIYISVMV